VKIPFPFPSPWLVGAAGLIGAGTVLQTATDDAAGTIPATVATGTNVASAAVSALILDPARLELRVAAVAHPDRFQGKLATAMGMAGYHFLVWDQGRAASAALLTTPVGDRTLHAALDSLGAVAGDELGMDTWERRYDQQSRGPDQVIQGTPVWLGLSWADQPEPIALDKLLLDPGGSGFTFRFGGHLANVPVWKSGCSVCLYSCPGSKVGNASYTVRDFVRQTTRFRVGERFPATGTAVEVVFRIRPEAPALTPLPTPPSPY
jgi:hypothetical protein